SAACGGSPTSPTPAQTLTATVADAVGDTIVYPVLRNGVIYVPILPVPPDLVSATINVVHGGLSAAVSVSAGPRPEADTLARLLPAVDENPSTGNPSAGGDVPLGFDYSVCAVNPRGSTTAQVSRLNGPGTTSTGLGAVPATFPSTDQIRFTVPLA